MKNTLGQIIEGQLVGNIYDKNRDSEIKKADEEADMKGEG